MATNSGKKYGEAAAVRPAQPAGMSKTKEPTPKLYGMRPERIGDVQVVLSKAEPGKKPARGAGSGKRETPGYKGARTLREGVERSLFDRATALLSASLKRMTTEQIEKAIAAPTPAATIVEVLNAAPEVGLARETATTRALARGAAAKQEMIQAAGGCLSSGEVAKLLGKTVSAVNQRRARNQIVAVPLSGGEWGFPASQFSSGDLRPGVAEVAKAAKALNPWVLLSIVLDRVPGTGTRIIDSLDDRDVREDVLTRVRSYGQQGAS